MKNKIEKCHVEEITEIEKKLISELHNNLIKTQNELVSSEDFKYLDENQKFFVIRDGVLLFSRHALKHLFNLMHDKNGKYVFIEKCQEFFNRSFEYFLESVNKKNH